VIVANGLDDQKRDWKSTAINLSLPFKMSETAMNVNLFREPIYTKREVRIEMVKEAMKCANRSTPLSPPCGALIFNPDDGSVVSTLTTSTTRSTPNIRKNNEIFSYAEDIVRKTNEVDPATVPHGSTTEKRRVFQALTFEDAMDTLFFRMFDALVGDEAMMIACQDPVIGRPIPDDFFSMKNGNLAGLDAPRKTCVDVEPIVSEFVRDRSSDIACQSVGISFETDHQIPNFSRRILPGSIPVTSEAKVREIENSSWQHRTSFLPSFRSSSFHVEGYSPSITLDSENDFSSVNQDDSFETINSCCEVNNAVSEIVKKPLWNVGLATQLQSSDQNDAGPAEPNHPQIHAFTTTAEFAPGHKKEELEITMPDEYFDEGAQAGSFDELVFINRHDFEVGEEMLQFLHPEEEIVFESEIEELQVEESDPQEEISNSTQEHSSEKSTSKRKLGLRFLLGPRLRRRLKSFSWSKKNRHHDVQNLTKKSKTRDDPAHRQSSPGTVATTAFTIPSDSDTIQDFSLAASTRPLAIYEDQDSYSDQHDYHDDSQHTKITVIAYDAHLM
jgi:hypothetical protein